MKIAEIVVGETYETKVSGFRAPVVVRREIQDHNGRRLFEVSRPETPAKLMRRTAAALHPRTRRSPARTIGYVGCACRDCMEIAIGSIHALCSACETAGCEAVFGECKAPAAYGCSEE